MIVVLMISTFFGVVLVFSSTERSQSTGDDGLVTEKECRCLCQIFIEKIGAQHARASSYSGAPFSSERNFETMIDVLNK
jgi:hypothetical protein